MNSLRIFFFGTAELASASLAALAGDPRCQIIGVVTQPDRPRGRALQLAPPPVKVTAQQLGLEVMQPEKCRRPEFIEVVRAARPDVIVVAAYGQILPMSLLNAAPHGGVNVHASLLPRHRGAAPIQWAILDGDSETGVTIMQMDAGLDTGPMLSRESTPITPDDTAQTLHDRLARMGANLLLRTLPGYVSGEIRPQPQPETGATYARKITRDDGRLDWSRPAVDVMNRVRGLTPWPGTFTHLLAEPRSLLLKVWAARIDERSGPAGSVLAAGHGELVVACGERSLQLLEVQREGGRRLKAAEFLAGFPLTPGIVLGGEAAPGGV